MATEDFIPVALFLFVALMMLLALQLFNRYSRPRRSALKGTYALLTRKYYRERTDPSGADEPLGWNDSRFQTGKGEWQYFHYMLTFASAISMVGFLTIGALVFDDLVLLPRIIFLGFSGIFALAFYIVLCAKGGPAP